jgi:hypothetical protein
MAVRLNQALREILLKAPVTQRLHIINNAYQVAKAPNGLYALIDYLNFKHEGTNPSERYQGQGWGLMQVLSESDFTKREVPATKAFAETARKLLTRRIQNSPNQKIEEQWFAGWINRLKTYTQL